MTTYVLVHGAFGDGWYWGETTARLEKEGHRVYVADMPSTGTDPAGLGGLAEFRQTTSSTWRPRTFRS